jgi:hypothetical protein
MIIQRVQTESSARASAIAAITAASLEAVVDDGAGVLRIGYIGSGRIRYAISGVVADTTIATVPDVESRLYKGGDTMVGPLSLGSAAPVTSSYTALYRNGDGRVGVSPSAARFKKNVRDKSYTLEDLLRMRVVNYQLRADLFDKDDPHRANGPVEVGVIAEDLVEAGLSEFVVFDEDGQPLSVHYERLALVAISALQGLAHQHAALDERLTALENRA